VEVRLDRRSFRVRDRWNFRGHSWWRTATTFHGVLRGFRAEPGPYTAYRCTNVTTSSAHNADKEVAAQFARFHLGVTDNCLTRAVAILRAYGAKLPGTDVSAFPGSPTAYVAKNLAGWEAPEPLSRGGVSRAAFTLPGAPIELRGTRPALSLPVSSRAAGSLAVLLYSPIRAEAGGVGHRRSAERVPAQDAGDRRGAQSRATEVDEGSGPGKACRAPDPHVAVEVGAGSGDVGTGGDVGPVAPCRWLRTFQRCCDGRL
jgi:hypothetical protein